MNERLDVLIPHFEDVTGLRRSLESVRRQSWDGMMRLVVVDDGSGDATKREMTRLLDGWKGEVHLEQNDRNRGRPYTRNRLLACINSPYGAWLDAGDTWHPTKLAQQFARLEQLRAAGYDSDRILITSDYDWRWAGMESIQVEQRVEQDQLRALLEGQTIRAYLWTLLGTAGAIKSVGPFDEKLTRLQDLDFFIRFQLAGGRLFKPVADLVNPLSVYEKSDIGRDAWEIRRCCHYLQSKHQSTYLKYGKSFARKRRVQAELLALRFAKNNGDYSAMAFCLGAAAVADPIAACCQLLKKSLFKNRVRDREPRAKS